MSHPITDVDTFTAIVTVPDGTDPGSGRSENVEAIAQALANRTHYLNLHAAKFGDINTWQQPQVYDIDLADAAPIRTTKDANDHTGSSSNIFKIQLDYLLNDGTRVRLYSGDEFDHWILTTNAAWDPGSGAQSWSKDDTGKRSLALWNKLGELRFVSKAAGAGTWGVNGWDGTEGDMRATHHLIAGDQVQAGGDIVSGNDIHATHNFRAGDVYMYEAPPVITKSISPMHCVTQWGGGSASGVTSDGNYVTLPPGTSVVYPIHAPADATLGAVYVKLYSTGVAEYTIELKHRYDADFFALTLPTNDVKDSDSGLTVAATVLNVINLNFGDLEVDPLESYEIYIANDAGAAAALQVTAIGYQYVDPGPRNH